MCGFLEKIRRIMALIGDSETTIVGGEEMEDVVLVTEVGWTDGAFDGVALENFDPTQSWDLWGSHMQHWCPQGILPDSDYFRLESLRLVKDGTMGMHVTVVDENGAPLSGVAVAQGWKDGPALPADSIPNGTDPRAYPNRGNVMFTNAMGVAEWTWGPGEGFAPENEEGAHWFWVPMGPSGIYSDVVYGFGWRLGTNHYHVEIKLRRSEGGDEPGTFEEIIADLADDISEDLAFFADRMRALAR